MSDESMDKAMSEFLSLVQDITGKQPDVYNAEKGIFEKHLQPGESCEDESEQPKKYYIEDGSVTVMYAGQKRTMYRGDRLTIPAHAKSVFSAVSSATIYYSYAV